MSIGNGTQSQQNKAHRDDLTWAKVGRSEYMRSDGVTIRKNQRLSFAWWEVFLPSGQPAQALVEGQYTPHMAANGPSLTWAKWAAEGVTADSPAYEAIRTARH